MMIDEARLRKFFSGLGLSSPLSQGKQLRLFQGDADLVVFDGDVLRIHGADIREVRLLSGKPKLSFQELESIIGLSQRLKNARFPALELELSVEGKVTGAAARILTVIPALPGQSDPLVGLPASAGKITGQCVVYPSQEDITGRILVLQQSRELYALIRKHPAGIILEEGNLLSHASILAREAKIPAIVRVPDATSKLRSGDRVELDANKGTIRLLG